LKENFSVAGPEIKELLKEKNAKEVLKEIFSDVHPYEVFTLIEGLENVDIAKIIMLLGFPLGAEVFEYFEDDEKEEIFSNLSREEMIELIEEMSADERVDFLKTLDDRFVDSLMPFIAQAERNEIKKLLSYREGTA